MPQSIQLDAAVNAPIERVFDILNDHQQFGEIWPGRTRRIKDSTDPDNVNGLGSEREIRIGPIPGLMIFREAIVTCERPYLLEYKAVGLAPIKNHLGRIQLREVDGRTEIDYRIQLDSVIPGLTGKILADLKKQWARGFPQLQARMEQA